MSMMGEGQPLLIATCSAVLLLSLIFVFPGFPAGCKSCLTFICPKLTWKLCVFHLLSELIWDFDWKKKKNCVLPCTEDQLTAPSDSSHSARDYIAVPFSANKILMKHLSFDFCLMFWMLHSGSYIQFLLNRNNYEELRRTLFETSLLFIFTW